MNERDKLLTIAWCIEMMIRLDLISSNSRKIQKEEMFAWDDNSIYNVQQMLRIKGIEACMIGPSVSKSKIGDKNPIDGYAGVKGTLEEIYYNYNSTSSLKLSNDRKKIGGENKSKKKIG